MLKDKRSEERKMANFIINNSEPEDRFDEEVSWYETDEEHGYFLLSDSQCYYAPDDRLDEGGSCYETDEEYSCYNEGADDYWGEPEFLVEETWKDDDQYDPNDGGVGFIRYFMESVKPSEVGTKDIGWIAIKYNLLSASTLAGLLSKNFFEDERVKLIFGRYAVAMEKCLRDSGIEFEVFHGLTEKGYETLSKLTKS